VSRFGYVKKKGSNTWVGCLADEDGRQGHGWSSSLSSNSFERVTGGEEAKERRKRRGRSAKDFKADNTCPYQPPTEEEKDQGDWSKTGRRVP